MNNDKRLWFTALILAVGMVISAGMLSKFFLRIRHEQSIAVKGYAEKDAVSDIGKFSCTFRARGATLKEAYLALQNSRDAVRKHLKERGFAEADIALETIATEKIAKRDAQGKPMNEIEFYDLSQSATIESTNVTVVRAVSTDITELIKDGVDLAVSTPEFYITDLKDTKIKLLAEATADGYRRAITLAEQSHGKVGALISAEQGVFQITTRNSTDTSGYGVYDTATIDKTVKAIVTLKYEILPNNRPASSR